MQRKSVLLIYTGGTIGMVFNHEKNTLTPVNFNEIEKELPELRRFDFNIDTISFDPPIDSSNVTFDSWIEIAKTIQENYEKYDGFVVLHGTDTMAYTASALSFMFSNLAKPVVLTGSQIPIGILRTDGKENLITALEIAASYSHNEKADVPEVSIFFNSILYRGNRAMKWSADQFEAFKSPNYPVLAVAGIDINYRRNFIISPDNKPFEVDSGLSNEVACVRIFPSMQVDYLTYIASLNNIRGLILETYGAGNMPTDKAFRKALEGIIQQGVVILNISQCLSGSVNMSAYETGKHLLEIGVINGGDMTLEAATTKFMHLLGKHKDKTSIGDLLCKNLRGEKTDLNE
ncbi:MAG: asparaginase [Bacteroidales bacterium]